MSNQFEEGFLKEAAEHGCDVDFLRGYIKQADEVVNIWKDAFDELAEKSGDPLYRYKMAQELMYLSTVKDKLEKVADATGAIQGALSSANGQASNWQNQLQTYAKGHQEGPMGGMMKWLLPILSKNPNLLSNLISGGGSGGLIGLLLGALTGHPMIGGMLGALGGAGIGAYMNHTNMMDAANNFIGGGNNTDPNQKLPSGNQLDSLSAGKGPVNEANAQPPQDPGLLLTPSGNRFDSGVVPGAAPSGSPQHTAGPSPSPVAPPTGSPVKPAQPMKPLGQKL